MKPLHITISAFGPFADRTEIDLGRFGDRGIYLITGDTGAGKTTVFDSICFALFGEASGKYRSKAASYRCTYAGPETPTFVQLVFEHRGERYTVIRNPEYERPKARGEGITKETAKAELHFPDGRVISKVSDVNAAVEELIGLNHDRFTQISMLAQGDFQRLLNADTKDRIEIFRRIFNTYPYQQFQDKLKERYLLLNAQYKEQKSAITRLISGIVCCDGFSERLDEIRQSGVYSTETVCALLDEMLEADRSKLQTVNAGIKADDEQTAKCSADLKSANDIIAGKERRDLLIAQSAKLESDRKTADEALKVCLDGADKRRQMSVDQDIINQQLPEYEALERLFVSGTEISREINELNSRSDKIKKERETASAALADALKSRTELADVEKQSSDATVVYTKLNNTLDSLNALKELIAGEKEARRKYVISSGKYETARKEYESERSLYARMETAFFDAQAGVLAGRLTEGRPCPVCGSLSHPSPACLPDQAPDEPQLKAQKEKLEGALTVMQEATEKAKTDKGVLDNMTESVKKSVSQLLGAVDRPEEALSGRIAETKSMCDAAVKKLEQLKDKLRKREELDRLIPELQKTVDGSADVQNETDRMLSSKLERREQLRARYKETAARLRYKSKAEATGALDALDRQMNQFDTALKSAQDKVDELKEKQSSASAEIKVLSEKLDKADLPDIGQIKSRLSELSQDKQRLDAERESIIVRSTTNGNIRNSVAGCGEQMDLLAKQLSTVSALSTTANGAISGKDKIGFETYVQIKWFDRIINMANRRFSDMTGGQYKLIRRTNAENQSKQSGLDLDVIDFRNGTSRSVKTLSGGESFKASLSLALGLSDVVQAVSGGISLDAMYIDEGFGSLDEESLHQAIEVLRKLSDGNRVVGIISHVSELKQQFDRQLIVTKDEDGISHVKIEY